jgi:hypothetical protein
MRLPQLSTRSARQAVVVGAAFLFMARCAHGPNRPPVAKVGPDQTVDAGARVTLDGSRSRDPDGDPLTFSWKQVLGTPVSVDHAPRVTFTAPPTGTTLRFELTVSDKKSSSVATTNVSVHPVDASGQVVEVHQQPVNGDIAVTGDFPRGWSIPRPPYAPPPTDDPVEGAFELIESVQWAPLVEVDLAPQATREVALQLAGPAAVAASVRWVGTRGPLDARLLLDGSPLATAAHYSFALDRGGCVATARTTAPGRATFIVTNTSEKTVAVRISFGAMGL